jgi:2-keto-3-deoxy-L-rhamnonate aldolase
MLAPHLTRQERFSVIECVKKAVGDMIVIGGVFGQSVGDVVDEIESAKLAGADYAIVLTPNYFGPGITKQEGIIEWFEKVAEKAVLSFLIYNYPAVSNNVDITADTFRTLAKHEKIVGCKLTHVFYYYIYCCILFIYF